MRKRKNKTIIEAINEILHNHNPFMILWEEACMTQYMFIIPKEVFTEIKPEIEHFRLFGWPVYFHVPKENKSNLYPLERNDTMNLQIHSRSTSLVRDKLRQIETLSLKKR